LHSIATFRILNIGMQKIAFIFIVSFVYAALGAETDNFSNRKKPLADASDAIKKIVVGYLSEVIQANKSEQTGCEKEVLFKLLKFKLNTNFPEIYGAVERSSLIERGRNQSGYAGAKISGAAATINVNGHLIGTDKIDHLFSHGFPYLRVFQKTNDVEKALDLGIKQENGCWGLSCNGVKSYGDLGANYKGFLFWSRITEGENPYIVCKDNSFELSETSKFDIKEYVDDSMDEALNCSSFDSAERAATVAKNIEILGFERCPVEPKKCETLVSQIPINIAKKILHPACLSPNRKDISFVEIPGEGVGLSWLETLETATDGVQINNLLKGIGVK
jgi:hypothetical protein